MPDLPYQGAIKIRNTELLLEKIGVPIGIEISFPHNSGRPQPKADTLFDHPGIQDDIVFTTTKDKKIYDKYEEVIGAFFASMDNLKMRILTSQILCLSQNLEVKY